MTIEIVIEESVLRGGGVVMGARRPQHGRLELFIDADNLEATLVPISVNAVLEIDPTLWEVLELGEGRHAWRFAEDESFMYARSPVGPTFMRSGVGELERESSSPLSPRKGIRADIVAWVRAPDIELALCFAKDHLLQDGWSVELAACQRCEREQFLENEEWLFMYDQAQLDGEVFSISLDADDLSPEQLRWIDENHL